ncbi:MAG: carbohydrate kinase family protein [Fimbriimonadaceae bacterium]|uniref:Carbohydrate kinase pfkB family n=1 Tax=Candidatus Nitrosymbiomonas proteolyticus TaxID=2608984 RepID=A0A809S6Y1_9BACT|nr:carbohydrate kinase family protein [Fimbriimonadaceae bacterium]NUM39573.1 carbohydrate kinase family protein [Armatimonadota bacterium]BBO24956.1 carbohydrate kinase pfkB family [Candidatus Nitrosymbiomonas proteolyticus]
MIVVFGTVCLDKVRRVPELPQKGGYVEIESETSYLGGEAANTAVMLARWRADVVLAGNSIGAGPEAAFLRNSVLAAELSADGVPMGAGAPPECDIYVTPDGERTMIGKGFSRLAASEEHGVVPLRMGGWFTADPNLGQVARQAARAAAAEGMNVYLMDFIQTQDFDSPFDVWQSSTDWCGRRGDDEANRAFLRERFEGKGKLAIVTDGDRKVHVLFPGGEERDFDVYRCGPVVDSTGAGDAFRAGMLYGLDQSWPLGKCLAFASAAGCLQCRSEGATQSVPSVDEVERLMEAQAEVTRQFLEGAP